MNFKGKLLEVELDYKNVVMPLLGKVREIWEMEDGPEGRLGCGDCEKVGELTKLAENIQIPA